MKIKAWSDTAWEDFGYWTEQDKKTLKRILQRLKDIGRKERNGLFRQRAPYEKRLYSRQELNRMYVIRLLLDNGYSMMAVRSFFEEYDGGGRELAIRQLMESGENEDLIYRAD